MEDNKITRKQEGIKLIAYNLQLIAYCFLLFGCDVDAKKNKGTQVAKLEEINWYVSFEEAEKEAKKRDVPIMIDFYAPWCIWCRIFENTTFKDKNVILELNNFIPLRIDVTKDQSIAKKYGITGLPTIIFVGTSGVKIHEIVGFREPKSFILEAKKALEKR